jgi:hypothetical protein
MLSSAGIPILQAPPTVGPIDARVRQWPLACRGAGCFCILYRCTEDPGISANGYLLLSPSSYLPFWTDTLFKCESISLSQPTDAERWGVECVTKLFLPKRGVALLMPLASKLSTIALCPRSMTPAARPDPMLLFRRKHHVVQSSTFEWHVCYWLFKFVHELM